jgi:molybdopterin molybdotransferase
MISVQEAEQIIYRHAMQYGTTDVPVAEAVGRVLAEDIKADRDLPPYNRVTMDGIAIRHAACENGTLTFKIKATQAAGDIPVDIDHEDECVEIMTGAAIAETADTVIRYEDLAIKDGLATIVSGKIKKGQSIHKKGIDKKMDDVVAAANQVIDPAIITIAATVGKTMLTVKKNPRVIIVSTGDELVDIGDTPTPYQVRRSNSYTIRAVLQQYHIPADIVHLPDEQEATKQQLQNYLREYDVIIVSGGISKGKYDYVPAALEALNVTKLFHGVKQRPGKPFWFGQHTGGALVFAFPGNPVSAFMCLHRYFLPWHFKCQISKSTAIGTQLHPDSYPNSTIPGACHAVLDGDFSFEPPLQYFLQVQLRIDETGRLLATPVEGNGSGDFANLLSANAFMELPMDRTHFKKGEVYKTWTFKPVI